MLTFSDIKIDTVLEDVKQTDIDTRLHRKSITQVYWCQASNYESFFLMNRYGSFTTSMFLDEYAVTNILLGNSENFFELQSDGIEQYGKGCKLNYITRSPESWIGLWTRWRVGHQITSKLHHTHRFFESLDHSSRCLAKITS